MSTTWPLAFVVYGPAGVSVPHAPAGEGVVTKVTVSPETTVPVTLVTVTVTVEVDVPFAWILAGFAAAVTELLAVWVMTAVWFTASIASVAVRVQVPAVPVFEVYVTETWPAPFVVPVDALRWPQAPATLGLIVIITGSLETAVDPVFVTVTTTVEVDVPFAWRVAGVGTTATE